MTDAPDEPEESAASPAHRYPILSLEPGESLAAFLDRLLAIHNWPAESRAGDRPLLASLLALVGEEHGAAEFGAHLVRSLSFSADPAMALRHFDRYLRALGNGMASEVSGLPHNPEQLHFLSSLFSFSQYLSEIVIAHPEYLAWIFRHSRLNREKPVERYREQLAEALAPHADFEARRAAATLFKKRELLRIGIRDIRELGMTGELCRELSSLAQAVVEVALEECRARLLAIHGLPISETGGGESGYCIYAMGKLGAGELNFSSDVDIIFVYDEEGETEGVPVGLGGQRVRRVSNHEYFNALSRDVSSWIMDRNAEGFLFRVDARLRPEGINGPLARSRPAYSAYLNTQAGVWEKIAYQKARCLAGDGKLASVFDKIVEQFVYTHNVAEELFPEIARLKRRIDHESLDAESRKLDIKRGTGGIREIEFLVSAEQLLHGEEMPALRVRSTLMGLSMLEAAKIMDADTAERLERAYHLFRRVEHTLQMMHEAQTHRMPSDPREREALALRCGFLKPADFEKTIAGLRDFVRTRFEEKFHARGEDAGLSLLDHLLFTEEPPDEVLEQLRPAGLGTQEGYRALKALATGTREYAPSASARADFAKLLPMLLAELPRVALPELAVRHFDQMMKAARGNKFVYEMCLTHPPILRLFLRTLGFGSFLARQLIAHPEWLEEIFRGGGLTEGRTDEALASLAPPTGSIGNDLRRIRQFKQLEGFLLSTQEVLAVAPAPAAAARATRLAEGVLRFVAAVAEREALEGIGASRLPARWAIIGLGGIGDGQVHIAGDLDIAFVVEGNDVWMGEAMTRWVDRVGQIAIGHMAAISPDGQLWKVDARLRPDGAGAPLAATADRFVEYYRREAGLWEWQVLTKARAVAGDLGFGGEVLSRLYKVFGEIGPLPGLAGEIQSMRRRIEEHVRVPRNALFDMKSSPGGVVDVEFLTQFFQLGNHAEAAVLFPMTTEQALAEFIRRGDVPAEDGAWLLDHLGLLRILQRAHRVLWETTQDQYPATAEKQEALARGVADQLTLRFGETGKSQWDGAAAGLESRFERARAIFDRVLDGLGCV